MPALPGRNCRSEEKDLAIDRGPLRGISLRKRTPATRLMSAIGLRPKGFMPVALREGH